MELDAKCQSCSYYIDAKKKRETEVAVRLQKYSPERRAIFKAELEEELKRNNRILSKDEFKYILDRMCQGRR